LEPIEKMNKFETNKKNFWLLPISIIIGIGSLYFGLKDFDFEREPILLVAFGIFMLIAIPIYAVLYQKKIEVNSVEKFIEICYPFLKRRTRVTFNSVDRILIRQNVYTKPGVRDEITIYFGKTKITLKSDEISFFSNLKGKLKHEFKDKIEIF